MRTPSDALHYTLGDKAEHKTSLRIYINIGNQWRRTIGPPSYAVAEERERRP